MGNGMNVTSVLDENTLLFGDDGAVQGVPGCRDG